MAGVGTMLSASPQNYYGNGGTKLVIFGINQDKKKKTTAAAPPTTTPL